MTAVLFTGTASARSESDPDFGDLVNPSDSGSASLNEVDGTALLPALGSDYRSLQLLGALESVETAVAGGAYVSIEAQNALEIHAATWLKAYETQLGGGDQAPNFDSLFESTLGEQTSDSQVSVYQAVAQRLEGLYYATGRYNMALSLKRSGLGGYRTHTARPEGSVGLDSSQYQELTISYAPQLQEGITRSTQELRALLQKS